MIGNSEHQLARLAFGDVTEVEADRIRESVANDPVKARRLAEYEAMRVELRRLHDVPADQLSKERLREALLGKALRPEPKPSFRPAWLVVPVIVCLATYGATQWTLGQKQSSMVPYVSASQTKPSTLVALNADAPKETGSTTVADTTPKPVEKAGAPRLVSRRVVRRAKVDSSVKTPVPKEATKVETQVPDAPAVLASRTNTSQPLSTEVEPDSVPSIVLIDQTKETEPGAQRATEVGNSRNVLIGG